MSCTDKKILDALTVIAANTGTPPIVGIEQGLAPVGQVLTAGLVTGQVYVVLTTPETGGPPVVSLLLMNNNGTSVFPYVGPFVPTQTADVEFDLQYTAPIPVYFTNAGVQTQWYVRMRTVFNNETSTETSTTQYSQNGTTWVVTVPAGVPSLANTPVATPEIDLVYSQPLKLFVNNLGVKTSVYVRERKTFDNVTGLILTNVTEYSTNGTTWTTTPPPGIITIDAVEVTNGASFIAGQTFNVPPNCISVTVTVPTGTANVSFDGGATYPLTGIQGSYSWGEGTSERISNAMTVFFNGTGNVTWEV